MGSAALKHRPNTFHSFSIDPEIIVAHARGGPHVDEPILGILIEFDIVNKSKHRTPEFGMHIAFIIFDDPGSLHRLNNVPQLSNRLTGWTVISERFDAMFCIGALARNAVWRIGTRLELSRFEPAASRPILGTANHEQAQKTD
jgi:hypothetical protein